MIYGILRWITGIAIHWFYRDIRVTGRNRIPLHGPVFIAVNHQNALVDSLIAAWVVPRRVAMTAKATLAENPIVAMFFRALNVIPLRRVNDEAERGRPMDDRTRNANAFHEILRGIEAGGAVLIFPEGKSHNEPGLEPLRTGLARIALQGRDEWGIRKIVILPLGLVFEAKGAPGSVVGAHFGQPIELDSWHGTSPITLTDEIASRLRVVSESAEIPTSLPISEPAQGLRNKLIALASWWGHVTHELPISIARSMAIRRSKNADEPAMLTILFGVGLVLATYAVHLTVVGFLAHSFPIVLLYLAGLLCGAYWAAFEHHPRHY